MKQTMFDVGQIEVLRGPQGTLRGRAAPSGSITITTLRPDLSEFGGYLDATMTNKDGRNLRGALNIPLIEDTLALRVAGMMEENAGNHAKSIHTGQKSKNETDGYRVSLRYEPIDNLAFNLMHQRIDPERREYTQVESAHLRDSSLAQSPFLIKLGDRLSVMDTASRADSEIKRTGLEVDWNLGGVQMNYVGAVIDLTLVRANVDEDWTETIYTVSLKHQFTDDIMAYISASSSWRPGISTVGNFNTRRSALEESFLTLDPETSDSYEMGIKSAWLDNRLRLNGTIFYQEFEKYPYRSGGAGSGDGTFYVTTDPAGVESVNTFNFVAAVPVVR